MLLAGLKGIAQERLPHYCHSDYKITKQETTLYFWIIYISPLYITWKLHSAQAELLLSQP